MNGSLFCGSDSAFILFCLINIFLWNVCKIILNQSSNNRWWPSFAGTWQERFKVHSHWTVPLWMFCYSTSLFLLWANEPHSLFSIGFCIKCKFSSASGYELKYKLLLSSLQQKLAVGICLVYIKYQIAARFFYLLVITGKTVFLRWLNIAVKYSFGRSDHISQPWKTIV